MLAKANGRRPVGRPRTRWINYSEDLGWNLLELHSSKMMDVIEDREVWRLNFELLPRTPHGKAGNEEKTKDISAAPHISINNLEKLVFSPQRFKLSKLNLLLYLLYYAESCDELAGPISASLSLVNTSAHFKEMFQRWRSVGNTVFDMNDPRFELQTSTLEMNALLQR